MPRFGAHLSIAGGHANAVAEARRLGFDSLQVFTKNNTQWAARPLEADRAAAFRDAVAAAGLVDPVGHASYLINLASPDPALWEKSIAALVDEVGRAEALGLVAMVVHPGAHMGAGEEAGVARVAAALDAVHERTPGVRVQVALETTAGQGTTIGHRFDHLGAILGAVREAGRLAVCVDTCHILAAGYRLADPSSYTATIGELDRAVGLGRVRVWHLNDSLRECGSRVDRHAGIGRGHLGLEAFRRVVADPRFAGLPMILETPKGHDDDGEELDAANLRLLRGLVDPSPPP